jgi:NADPH-dependent glutamate synthase beta subunit-like oxidoreductase
VNRGRKQRGDKPVVDTEKRKEEERALMAIATGSNAADGEINDEIRGASFNRKTINMELKWLEDPRDLADRVARILRSGDPAMAAALVRQAQKEGRRCDVAWNHLLSYCMQRGFPQVAFKFYNDVSF